MHMPLGDTNKQMLQTTDPAGEGLEERRPRDDDALDLLEALLDVLHGVKVLTRHVRQHVDCRLLHWRRVPGLLACELLVAGVAAAVVVVILRQFLVAAVYEIR